MSREAPSARRLGRRLAIAGGGLVTALALVVLGAYLLAQSAPGRAWIAQALAAVLSEPGEREVSIVRLEGQLPHRLRLEGVAVSDPAGRWLSARAVALDWRPLALFSDRLEIAALRIDDLALERLPAAAPEAEDETAGGLPRPPFDLVLERLAVEDLHLGEAVLGAPVTLAIHGEAAVASATGLTSRLRAERTDGVPGHAEVVAAYDPSDARLRLDASVAEPAGGVLARALELPGLPPVTVALAGEAPVANWRGHLTIDLAELASLDAQVTAARDAEKLALTLSGRLRGERPGEALPWRLLAAGADLSLGLDWREARELVLHEAILAAPAGRLALAGRLDAETLRLEARGQARLDDPALIAELAPGLEAEALRLEARAEGNLLQPHVMAEVAAERLAAPGFLARRVAAEFEITPRQPLDRGPLAGDIVSTGRVAEVSATDLAELDPLLGGGLDWRLEGTFDLGTPELAARTLSLRGQGASLEGTATVNLAEGAGAARFELLLERLADLSPLIGVTLDGRAALDADVTLEPAGILRGTLNGGFRELAVDEPIAQALLGEEARIETTLLLEDGALVLSDLELESADSRLTGSLRLEPDFEHLTAEYRLRTGEAAVLSEPLGVALRGAATLVGRAEGPPDDPTLSGTLVLARGEIQTVAVEELTLDYRVEALASEPRGHLAARGSALGHRWEGATDFAMADESVTLTGLRAQGAGAAARGSLSIPLAGGALSGSLQSEADDVAPLLALAEVAAEAAGSASLELRLSPAGARQGAELSGRVGNLVWRRPGAPALAAETARISWQTESLFGPPSGRARIEAEGIGYGSVSLASLSLTAEGDRGGAAFRLAAAGAFRGPLEVEAAGEVTFGDEAVELSLASMDGRAFEQDFRLRRALLLRAGGEELAVSGLDLGIGSARLEGQARIGAENLSAEARLDGLSLAALAPLWSMPGVSGEIAARVALSGTRTAPRGTGRLDLSRVQVETIGEEQIFGVRLDADWAEGRLALRGALTGTPGGEASLAASLPLRLDPESLAVSVPADDALDGRLAWQGDVAKVWALVPLVGHRLAGRAELLARLEGTAAAPSLAGHLELAGGEYENFETGTLLRNLALRLELDGERAVLSRLSADDGGQGRLRADGRAALAPAEGYPVEIEAELRDFTLVRRDDITAVTDGRLLLDGPLDDLVLSGQLETRSIEARIIQSLPVEVVELQVTEIGAGGKIVAEPAEEAGGGAENLRLDLGIVMPRRVFVRGRGLESEWTGELQVSGPAEAPRLAGELSLVRGQLSMIGRTFKLTSGTVTFDRGGEIDPILAIEARHEADITVIASVEGPASNVSISLRSLPPLPQEEIVSRVLFGKDAVQLSPFQAAQLAAALAELSGANAGATGIFDVARNIVGADILQIETVGSGESRSSVLSAGKYVSDDVYLGVKQGVTPESGSVGVEIDLTPNITVESDVGQGDSNVGIRFKWDY